MRNANTKPARRSPRPLACLSLLLLTGCASAVEIAIDSPLRSKLDVSRFRRLLVAGFASQAEPGEVDVQAETTRLLQNHLRSNSTMTVLEADRSPVQEALEQARAAQGGGGARVDRDQLRLDADRLLQDVAFWRKLGEEYQDPLIIAGRLGFESQSRTGIESDERVTPEFRTGSRYAQASRYLERKGFSLTAEFHFIDGRTGQTLHREKFTEEVLYDEEQRISPLSAYFELMDRLLPNVLGVISPQRIKGTRILLSR